MTPSGSPCAVAGGASSAQGGSACLGSEEGDGEEQMQPFLGALQLEDIAEEAKDLVIGDVPYRDLNQLQYVLEHVNALDLQHICSTTSQRPSTSRPELLGLVFAVPQTKDVV